jgi:hypothetical protein
MFRLALSMLLACCCVAGCSIGTSDVSRDYGFSALVGERYRTKVDLYLFSFPESKSPHLGINDGSSGFRARTLPLQVLPQFVGGNYRGNRILDIVPAGAEFTVNSVLRDVSSLGITVSFVCNLDYQQRHIENVGTLFIQSNVNGRDGRPPEIDSSLAALVSR